MMAVLIGLGAFWLFCLCGVIWLARGAGRSDECS